mgnify:FL=1
MKDRVLVAYATKYGSTREVAEAVAEELRRAGAAIDLQPAKEVQDLSRYQAVVLGSAIQKFKVLPEAVRFATKHRAALSQMPTAYFCVCLTMQDDTPQARQTAEGYLKPLRDVQEPVSMGLFAGKLDTQPMGRLVALFLHRVMHAVDGDYRDWDAIRAWASELAPLLAANR